MVLFALATALVATVLVGLVPALRASRTSLVDDMKNGTHGCRPGRRLRVVACWSPCRSPARSCCSIATGLCLRSFAKLSDLDLGFNPAQVLTFSVNGLNEEQFPSRAARHDMVDRLLANVEQLPQVRTAGAIFERPFEHGPIGMDSSVLLEGQADTPDVSNRNGVLNWESVTSHYFAVDEHEAAARTHLRRARQRRCRPHAVVSEATANHLWPGQDPIGQRLRLSFTESEDRWHTVVGVVATARYREIDNPRFDLYVPYGSRRATSSTSPFAQLAIL